MTVSLKEKVQKKNIAFLEKVINKKEFPMCGNTICQDRRFLVKYMPELEAYFHYRHIDVSTVKELARRWAAPLFNQYKKKSAHIALEDIKQSIAELRYYRDHFFKLNNSEGNAL